MAVKWLFMGFSAASSKERMPGVGHMGSTTRLQSYGSGRSAVGHVCARQMALGSIDECLLHHDTPAEQGLRDFSQ
eukprot:2384886-Amphidinium_carterae.1